MMRFSLCHPTARPAQWRAARDRWLGRAARPERVEHILAYDAPRSAEFKFDSGEPTRPVINTFRRDCVTAWNLAAEISQGDVLIAMADDFEPPERWDEALEQIIGDASREAVVEVRTGVKGSDANRLLALSIVTRARYERLGYLFYPMYRSMFCDDDFTEHARQDGVVIDARQLLFQHHHPITTLPPRLWDETYRTQNAPERYHYGQGVLGHRRAVRFGNEGRFAIQTLVVETFMLEESVRAVADDVEAIHLQVPTECWNGAPVTDAEVAAIDAVRARLVEDGYDVRLDRLDVAVERVPGRDRYEVEAAVRNQGLRKIRARGCGAVLVVDSDELWLPECATRVFNMFYAGVTALTVQMIPVIGMPAYPVDGATDAALVLLAGGQEYTSCRSTRDAVPLGQRLILHFTGTRGNREAIAAKMRQSGHYGDPQYDFEGWISGTLPRIAPGLENAHMFRPWQIWPRVRRFTDRERRHIPARLHPYLGA